MIRLKQSVGNVIKCKIDTEDMISKYEYSILEKNRLNGLFSMQMDKNSTILYSDDVRKNLADVLSGSVDGEKVNSYLCQIARVILDITKMGLNPEKLILNPEWIFLTKDEKILKFIYCPVNGMCGRYEAILFMHDVLLMAPLSKGVRDAWEQWLESVTKTGITEKSVSNMEKIKNGTNAGISNDRQRKFEEHKSFASIYGDDDEPMTGIDDDNDMWPSMHEMDIDDEPMTGVEDADDGEAPTGVEEFDGFCLQVMSEPASNKPYLVRVSTGEKVVISSDNFKLGRSEQRADFCIRNNSGISNVHANVIEKNGQYFLKDNYSTNGTYVDGNKIVDSSTPVLLRDGSVIQLYNEEIVFNY